MQIVIGGVVYYLTAEAVFLLVAGIMTIYALLDAGIAWIVGDENGGSCFDPNSGSSENEDLPLCESEGG